MTGKHFLALVIRSGTVKVLGTASVFALSITLARSLGSAQYGVYVFAFSLLSFLVLICKLGFPDLTVRETSRLRAVGRNRALSSFLHFQRRAIFVLSATILITTFAIIYVFLRPHYTNWAVFAIGLPLPFIFSLIAYNQAIMRGSGAIVRGQLAHQLIRPAIFLLLISVTLFIGKDLSASSVMALHVGASVLVYFWTLIETRKYIPDTTPVPVSRARMLQWSKSAAVFAGVSVARVINTKFDIIALGLLMSYSLVGSYAVAAQIATACAAMTFVTSSVVMPSLSSLSVTRDKERLEQLCIQSSQISLLSISILWVVMFFFGKDILTLVFGGEYAIASETLLILLTGQAISAFFGPVGDLMNMRGHEKSTFMVTLSASGINIVLNLVLIPLFGIEGAALATILAMSFWNIVLWRKAWLVFGINSSAIPFQSLLKTPHNKVSQLEDTQ